MLEKPHEYCPYCGKEVPMHKEPRKFICLSVYFLLIINLALLTLMSLFMHLIGWIWIPIALITLIFLWIEYFGRVKPSICNICGSRTSTIKNACSHCGKQVYSSSKFCNECGSEL
jgi:NADH pyrophosphatase NudC (nudix superfamily)